MDGVHISGIGPSSLILNQTKYCEMVKCNALIIPKQVEAKKDGEMDQQHNNLNIL